MITFSFYVFMLPGKKRLSQMLIQSLNNSWNSPRRSRKGKKILAYLWKLHPLSFKYISLDFFLWSHDCLYKLSTSIFWSSTVFFINGQKYRLCTSRWPSAAARKEKKKKLNARKLSLPPTANIKWLINKQVRSIGKITASLCYKIFITTAPLKLFLSEEPEGAGLQLTHELTSSH